MKKLILIIILIGAFSLYAVEKIDVLENDPFPLTHGLSAAEAARWDETGRDFYETDPPVGPVRNVAEFEKMEGVLIRYPFGIPLSLIAAMSEQAKVVTIVSSMSDQVTVLSQYNSQGVNTANCEFLIAPTDSYWTRDYGPWYVIDGEGEFGIINFPFNRPRPYDNDIPIELADYQAINLFGMDVIHTGGNYMTDGLGISASTNLVVDENSIPVTEINQKMLDYLGIQTYFVIDDPNNTYIDHINCWGKFLDVDKVLIREVPPTHAQYDEIEAVAEYFADQTTSYGNTYQVYRVYSPNDQPYANTLILNDHVYMPLTGGPHDDEALAVFEEAMPGYTVVGVLSGPEPWESTDGLHCRVIGIADREMLYIYHLPYLDEQPVDVDLVVSCDITPYSGAAILYEEVFLHYRIGVGEYQQVLMLNVEDNTFAATIPGQPEGSMVSYYISAFDEEAHSAFHPFIGEADPHVYFAGGQQYPVLEVDHEVINMEMPANSTNTQELQLTNTGGGVINYSIEFQDTNRDVTGSYVICDDQSFNPGETINLDFTVYNNSPDNEWIQSVAIDFPEGFEVIVASGFWGGSGGLLRYEGAQGNGALVTWYGESANGYGVLHCDESAFCTVEVYVAPDFSGNALLDWTITGDNFGADPHTVSGDIELGIYGDLVGWITASQFDGDLWAMETDIIDLMFDTADLEEGYYSCSLIINWEQDEEIIPVNLTVSSQPADEDEVAPLITTAVVYPNPFNGNGQRDLITLEFNIAEPVNDLEITVYNLKGQKVAELYQGEMTSGENQIYWNGKTSTGKSAPAGLYFLKLSSSAFSIYKKAIILK
ncbi:MAG: agmatine deiminase family protein [Candidatus Cloacimonetes bacterium]|nr:agmatine deiminase family protein [Candidatus Cloacimonadota bacterium]